MQSLYHVLITNSLPLSRLCYTLRQYLSRYLAMDDAETQTTTFNEQTPLLRSDREYIASLRQSRDFIACHIVKIHGEDSWVWDLRQHLQRFLSSKWGHYAVITLVAADISCIFADFLISLHICEHSGDKGFNRKAWEIADDVLDYVSLAFSCLFMAELLASVFAFGFRYVSQEPQSAPRY